MIFPYFKYNNPDGTRVELPLLSLRVACNRKHVKLWALVDSGADITVFNGSIGKLLDIDIKKGRALELHGFVDTKDKYAAYTHQVNLAVQGLPSVDTVVAFTDSDRYPDVAILGRMGFFEKFKVTFEHYSRQIQVQPKPLTSISVLASLPMVAGRYTG